jgi:hypothetical protein
MELLIMKFIQSPVTYFLYGKKIFQRPVLKHYQFRPVLFLQLA